MMSAVQPNCRWTQGPHKSATIIVPRASLFSFLFLKEQIKGIIIITEYPPPCFWDRVLFPKARGDYSVGR